MTPFPSTDRDEVTATIAGYGHAITWQPCGAAREFSANPMPRDDAQVAPDWYRTRCLGCGANAVSGPSYFYGESPLFNNCVSRPGRSNV